MSTELTHFLTLINNVKAFCSLDGMVCSYQCSDQIQFPPGPWLAVSKMPQVRQSHAIKNVLYYGVRQLHAQKIHSVRLKNIEI